MKDVLNIAGIIIVLAIAIVAVCLFFVKEKHIHVIEVTFYNGSKDTVTASYYSTGKHEVVLDKGDLYIKWHKTLASNVRTYKEMK